MLSSCMVVPVALDPAEREAIGKEARRRLFDGTAAPTAPVTLAEATARAVKHFADYRLRVLEETLSEAQLDASRFDLLPRLTASAGYTTRNNDAFGFGFSPGGGIAANPSASTERTRTTLNLGFTWNALDFGISYFRAKQLGDQVLIARERRRKAVQILAHDVRSAWWRAEAAQRLLPQIDALFGEIEGALERTRMIEARRLLPPMQIVSLRRALLELEQQLSFRRQELAQARIELAALINLPPGSAFTLSPTPIAPETVDQLTADPERLDALALSSRPELSEEGYRARISEAEAKKAILGLLPGLSLDFGLNHDSNRFLVNNTWSSAGLNIALNLIRIFSLPAIERTAEAQRRVDDARRMAMAMAVLTQTRVAAVRYGLLAHEFLVWDEAAGDDRKIVTLLEASASVGVDSELELIRAKARALVSGINRDLSHANLQGVVGQLFQSVGYDVIAGPDEEERSVGELTSVVEERLSSFIGSVFTPQSPPAPVTVTLGPIGGVDPATGARIAEGVATVFSLSRLRTADPRDADFRIVLRAKLQPPQGGGQPVQIDIQVIEQRTGGERHRGDFRTTLSAPADAEQLRALGEGAAYRALVSLPAHGKARLGSRLPMALKLTRADDTATEVPAPSLDGEPLGLTILSALSSEPAARPNRERGSRSAPGDIAGTQ